MSYRIEYDSSQCKYEVRQEKSTFAKGCLAAAILLVCSLCLWNRGREAVCSFLIPGEDAVTIRAIHMLTDDLRSGASMEEALEAFCRCVLNEQ